MNVELRLRLPRSIFSRCEDIFFAIYTSGKNACPLNFVFMVDCCKKVHDIGKHNENGRRKKFCNQSLRKFAISTLERLKSESTIIMLRKMFWLQVLMMACLAFITLNCAGEEAHSENGKNGAATDEVANKDVTRKEKKEELTPIETTVVTTGDISSFILLSSNLETEQMTDVYSRVQGLIKRIPVEEGDYVREGQLLMELEPDELALQEARARVDYEQEENLYQRKQAMFEKQLLSKEEFETAGFAVKAKKIQWQEAKMNLERTRITAPISGFIGERLRRPGDRIQPTDKLFAIVNNDEMIAVVHAPEKEIGLIQKGQKAFVTSQHLNEEQFAGWVKRVSPVVDPQSGTFKVTIGIRNDDNRLRPGMFVNTHIITDIHTNTVLIPKTAVIYENENVHEFVVRDGKAEKVTLDAGYQDYEKIESRSGINPGEKIIVVGQAGLKNGAKVKIVAEQDNPLAVAKLEE